MKNFFLTFFILLANMFAAQSVRDQNITKAIAFTKAQKWEQVISILQNESKNDAEVLYMITVAEFKVLKMTENYDFNSVNKVRMYATQYLQKFGGKKAEWTQNIREVYSALDLINPAKTLEEYSANEAAKEKLRLEQEKLKKINKLNDDLLSRNYSKVKSAVRSYENDQSLKEYHLQYFQAMADLGLLKNNDDFDFAEVLNVNNQLGNYLSNYNDANLVYTSKISDAQKFMKVNYPATQQELIVKREELKKKKLDLKLQDDLEVLKSFYTIKSYETVIRKANEYPADSKYSSEVDYYKTLSQYYIFIRSSDRDFNQIAGLRTSLNSYLNNKKNDNFNYNKELKTILNYVDDNFPKTLQDFNLKREHEQQVIAKREEERQREIRKQQRKISSSNKMNENFVALGYEGGNIAKYGLRFEVGGKSTIGFFLNARTSLTKEEDLLNGLITENKNEIVVGPSIKIAPWMFLNIGGGYGYYNYTLRNDYESKFSLETKTYYAGYGGVTFRLGNRFNLVGGASFIDIKEDFYAPEFTFGLTINLK